MRALFLLLLAAAAAQLNDSMPPDLASLAQAERDFAARAREVGVRDSFLEFFAEDAIFFAQGPVRAREGLLAGSPEPFAVRQLTWEPRLGDVAASGELGWLTGPAALVVPGSKDPGPHHQNYLSVWRREPGGPWRVVIDVGIPTPAPPPFAPGFTRFSMPDRFGVPSQSVAKGPDLAAADGLLNQRLASAGLAEGYAPVLTDGTRFHRPRIAPPVGPAAVLEWSRSRGATYMGAQLASVSARSSDVGYTYGSYDLAGASAESGNYLRVWQRRSDGTWVLAVDLMRPRG